MQFGRPGKTAVGKFSTQWEGVFSWDYTKHKKAELLVEIDKKLGAKVNR